VCPLNHTAEKSRTKGEKGVKAHGGKKRKKKQRGRGKKKKMRTEDQHGARRPLATLRCAGSV